jgi:hypothetical protein
MLREVGLTPRQRLVTASVIDDDAKIANVATS